MSTTLGDLATQIRSKNAGPFWITFDVFFADTADYERAAHSRLIDPAVIAARYAVTSDVVRIFALPDLNAIKVSFPRPTHQGGIADTDMHAGQQYIPLLDLEVP